MKARYEDPLGQVELESALIRMQLGISHPSVRDKETDSSKKKKEAPSQKRKGRSGPDATR